MGGFILEVNHEGATWYLTLLVCHFIGANHAVVIDNFGSRGATK